MRTRRDAIRYAIGCNHKHGAKRTNSDKRRCVLACLGDEEWGGFSDRAIAAKCGVGVDLVGAVRKQRLKGVTEDTNCQQAAEAIPADEGSHHPEGANSTARFRQLKNEGAGTAQTDGTPEPSKRMGSDGRRRRVPVRGPRDAEGPVDRLGNPVPKRLLAVFKFRTKMNGFRRKTAALSNELVASLNDAPAARALDLVGVSNACTSVKDLIGEALPHCVCPICKGVGCDTCCRSGWLTRIAYRGLPMNRRWPTEERKEAA